MADGTILSRRSLVGVALSAGLVPSLVSASAATASEAALSQPEELRLWPGLPPGARSTLPRPVRQMRPGRAGPEAWLTGIATPTLTLHRPRAPTGVGLLVMPGGGYEFLAIQNEGTNVARRLCEAGLTVGVLTYRLPAEGWDRRQDVPLQDAQRAMRLFRAAASRLGIDPGRIGVAGFSAGGHLAASLATGYAEPVYQPVDAADAGSARPAFAGLMYAVTTLELPDTHRGTREHLLGTAPEAAAVARRSPLRQVDARTPPCFLLHALDDPIVPPSCSLRWLEACRRAGVPVEAMLPQRGGHGFGVALPDSESASIWPLAFTRWIAEQATPA